MISSVAREVGLVHGIGEVVRVHPVDNDRRKTIGAFGIVVGVLGLVVSAAVVEDLDDVGARQALGGAIGLAISGFSVGVWHLVAAALRAEERIVVHERGLVHSTKWRDVVVPWDAVLHARVLFGQVRSPVAHYFGTQVWVRLAVRGTRRKVRFTGLAEGYDQLLDTVLRHCPPAPGRSPRARWAYAGLAVASVGVGAGLVAHLVADPEIPEAGIVVIVVGLMLCFVAGVTGIVLAAKRN